jgi:hypothetical protein
MIAAVLHAPRDLTIETRPSLAPGVGEAVVRVEGAGLCGTDYRIWNGDRAVDYPRVMGHELVGRVLALGSGVSGLTPGATVAVEPNYSCGVCPLCREGNKNLCLSRTAVGIDVDGGFAQEVALPAHCCWPAPAGIEDDQLLLTEPLAVVVRAVRRGAPAPGETAAVLGVGALGPAIQVLKARGCRVLAVGRSARWLPLARRRSTRSPPRARGYVEAARAPSGAKGSTWSSRPRAPPPSQAVSCPGRWPSRLTGLPTGEPPSFLGGAAGDQHPGSMIYQTSSRRPRRFASGQVQGRRSTHGLPSIESPTPSRRIAP